MSPTDRGLFCYDKVTKSNKQGELAMYQNQYSPYGSMYQSPYGNQGYYNSPYGNMQNNQQNLYSQPQPQVQQQNAQQPMQVQSNIEYVNGIEGAKALILPPNAQKMLLDSDNPFFYIKTTDMQGKPTVKRFRYVDVDAEQDKPKEETPKQKYATLEQLGQLSDTISDLRKEIERLKKQNVKEDRQK